MPRAPRIEKVTPATAGVFYLSNKRRRRIEDDPAPLPHNTITAHCGFTHDGAHVVCDEKGKSVTVPNMKHEKRKNSYAIGLAKMGKNGSSKVVEVNEERS